MDDPRRLSDSDSTDALARVLRAGQGLQVDYDLPAALARHERLVAAGVRPLAPAGAVALRGLSIAVAVAVVGVAAWLVARAPDSDGTSAPPVRPSAIAHEAVVEVPEPRVIATTPAIVPRPEIVQAPVVAPASTSTKARENASVARRAAAPPKPANERATTTTSTADDDRIAREAAQVRRIRELLAADDAAAALGACDEGDREFGQGVFALERDGLRVLAALALDGPRAHEAAEAYLDAHPRAPLAPRIRAALDGRVREPMPSE